MLGASVSINYWLVVAGALTILAAVLHLLIIAKGAPWYRLFGAGEKMAIMAERGSYYPGVVTAVIATILFIWGAYAFAGAGVIAFFPLMKLCLALISAIFLLRAVAGLIYYYWVGRRQPFMLYSSVVCLVYASCYCIGSYQVWPTLSLL